MFHSEPNNLSSSRLKRATSTEQHEPSASTLRWPFAALTVWKRISGRRFLNVRVVISRLRKQENFLFVKSGTQLLTSNVLTIFSAITRRSNRGPSALAILHIFAVVLSLSWNVWNFHTRGEATRPP